MQAILTACTCSIVTCVATIAIPEPFKVAAAGLGVLAMIVASTVSGRALHQAGLIEIEADPGQPYRRLDPAPEPAEPPGAPAGEHTQAELADCCEGCGYPRRYEGGRACTCHKCAPELFERCPDCARDVRSGLLASLNTLCGTCGYPRGLECSCHRCAPELYELCGTCRRDKMKDPPLCASLPREELQ